MQEIARLLAAHPPFDGLPPEALEQTAATVEVAYFPRGASILRQGGAPTRHLHLIVKGVVELRQADEHGASELVETLAEGETFGQLSLLSRSPHLWDAVAREDVLAYLIPAEHVGCPWSATAMAVRQGCPGGRHGGSHHGTTTTDDNHTDARQGAQEARWSVQGHPTDVRPAEG